MRLHKLCCPNASSKGESHKGGGGDAHAWCCPGSVDHHTNLRVEKFSDTHELVVEIFKEIAPWWLLLWHFVPEEKRFLQDLREHWPMTNPFIVTKLQGEHLQQIKELGTMIGCYQRIVDLSC